MTSKKYKLWQNPGYHRLHLSPQDRIAIGIGRRKQPGARAAREIRAGLIAGSLRALTYEQLRQRGELFTKAYSEQVNRRVSIVGPPKGRSGISVPGQRMSRKVAKLADQGSGYHR